jgi:ribonuclease BN (tRNA processing enzyme)
MRPPVFPVGWDDLAANVHLASLPTDGVPLVRGALAVSALEARHPGGAAGFRVAPAAGGDAVVYLPDNEIAEGSGDGAWRDALLRSVRGAALLVHDATYLPDELPTRGGWGHSSWDEAVRLAVDAGVRRLALFHHFAERSDDAVDELLDRARALADRSGLTVLAASEGLVLHV